MTSKIYTATKITKTSVHFFLTSNRTFLDSSSSVSPPLWILIVSLTPPVKSTKASEVSPPARAS